MLFGGLDIPTIIARAIVLLFAFTFHELAHALTADRLGDPTPRRMGRLTLNPLAHLDPLGTLLLLVSGFGWAKPVMVVPGNLRGNPRTSMALVAAAGPVSNLVMASLGAIPLRLDLLKLEPGLGNILPAPAELLFTFVWINLILAFFNLIPIPPLDGYRILSNLLPYEMAEGLRPLEQFGFLILMVVVFLAPAVLQLVVVEPAAGLLGLLLGAPV
ncbi:MAG: site-2 protease family protein [Candidatus Promineifilaceae bacterium]